MILPQIGSICRLHGSKRGAVDLLVGDSREAFQDETSRELEKVLATKDLTLLFGLTRHIYVPAQVREPIQKAKIADELTRTRDQEQLTAQGAGRPDRGQGQGHARGEADQRRDREAVRAGRRRGGEAGAGDRGDHRAAPGRDRRPDGGDPGASRPRCSARPRRRTTELIRQAEADRFRQYVQALGGPDAYNKYVFAEGLPPDLRLGIFYAGPGTFWTDLKGFEQAMLGKLASEPRPDPAPAAGAGRRAPALTRHRGSDPVGSGSLHDVSSGLDSETSRIEHIPGIGFPDGVDESGRVGGRIRGADRPGHGPCLTVRGGVVARARPQGPSPRRGGSLMEPDTEQEARRRSRCGSSRA